jgi:glycosyltransferase involved in cell wall biosynthesis
MQSVAIITSIAYSLSNFRGPFIQALVRRGVRVYALAPDHDSDSREQLTRLGAIAIDFPLSRTGMNPFADVINTLKLIAILRTIRPNIAYSYFIKPVIYGSIASAFAGVPRRFALVAGLGHAFSEQGSPLRFRQKLLRNIVKALLAIGFKLCHGVIFQNEDDRAEFTRSRLISENKTLRTRGTGVDLAHMKMLDWPKGPIVFLLAARLIQSKGICEYAMAAKRVRDEIPDARFILLGGIDANPESMKLAEVKTLVNSSKMEWFGHVNDVRPYLAQSHVFVLPSFYREGIPRSIQEAMASGRAIITTDSVGCRETVIQGRNGLLVPIKDTDALASAMKTLALNPDKARAFGDESRKLAESWFDVDRINTEILTFMGVDAPR